MHKAFGAIFEHRQLVVKAHIRIDLSRFVRCDGDTLDWQILLDDSVHFVLDCVSFARHIEPGRKHLAKHRSRRVVGKTDLHVGIEIVKSHRKHIAQTCLVRLACLDVFKPQKLYRLAVVLLGQLAIELLHLRAELAHHILAFFVVGEQIYHPRSFLHFDDFIVYFQL